MVFGKLLVVGATWALVLGAAWAVLICIAAVVEVLSDGRLALTSRLGCPASVRRALLAGLGAVLVGGGAAVAGPVSAAPAPSDSSLAGGREAPVSGLPVPARPTGSAYSLPRQRVEVRPGDSLWRLAEERSRTRTTPDVADLVARTYRDNRRTIGPEPDLILPGQRLVLPRQRQSTPPQPGTRQERP